MPFPDLFPLLPMQTEAPEHWMPLENRALNEVLAFLPQGRWPSMLYADFIVLSQRIRGLDESLPFDIVQAWHHGRLPADSKVEDAVLTSCDP